MLEDAGRVNVPFTTGILIGIGETLAERAESIFAIRQVSREYGGIQEVIVQNFRAKPDTTMRGVPDAELQDLAATIAVTRLVLGPKARIQAPPNLIGDEYALILRAGIDDWGGVSPLTPDHVNPERPWPQIDELAAHTATGGFTLRERLTLYPPYLREPWLDPRLAGHVQALVDPATGLANQDAMPVGRPWQEPDGGWQEAGRTDLYTTIDTTGRTSDRRDDFAEVYGDWDEVKTRLGGPAAPVLDQDVKAALRQAEQDPAGLSDDQALALLAADGPGAGGPDQAGRRHPPGRDGRRHHLRRQPEHQLHQRLLHRLPVLRVRPAPYRRRRLHAVPGTRSATGPRRPGSPARPRCACRAASTRTCPARPTSRSRPRSSGAARTCTCTRSPRWRCSTGRPAPGCRSGSG